MSEWFIYIILTKKNRLYTGITTDVERRYNEHASDSAKGAKFFRSDKPQAIVYVENCKNRSEASIKEAAVKKLTRLQKENFIKESFYGDNNIYCRRKKQGKDVAGSTRITRKGKL
ncbi:MAG: GIY-YIG nuclease family protein [Bacteriovorax sp.]|nr:GIY-YIG nuclease family protein [Bacteriovorax sp.]